MKTKRDEDALYQAHAAHFGVGITPEIEDYAINHAFHHSRYIFTKSVMRVQYGYCTHCKETYRTEGLKHNYQATCEKCGSSCTVKASGVSRKKLRDQVYFVFYDKSAIDPNVIVAKGIFAVRDYTGKDFKAVETVYYPSSSYVFKPGVGAEMYYKTNWRKCGWAERSVKSEFPEFNRYAKLSYSRESIEKAVKGTPFQYSTWEKFDITDMVTFFELYSKYPCVEFLTKFNCGNVVEAKLLGYKTYSAINWRGKKPESIFRLNKQNMRELKGCGRTISPLQLRLFQLTRGESSPPSFNELVELSGQISSYANELLELAVICGSVKKAIQYIKRQFVRKTVVRRYQKIIDALITWKDYVSDCKKLHLDLSDEAILFPIDLHAAHRRTLALVDVQDNAELNEKISKRLKSLGKLSFEANGFLIRPATSVAELIYEGKTQHICIGTYAERYAKGETDLFLIRRLNALDDPFYAMEIKNGKIVQTQTKDHVGPTPEVRTFIEAFTSAKLISSNKQGVAV